MDRQCEWAAGRILAQGTRAQVHGNIYRSGILLQCRRVDFPGLSVARGVCAKRSVCVGEGLGVVRAMALARREHVRRRALGTSGRDSSGMVWSGLGSAREFGVGADSAKGASAGID